MTQMPTRRSSEPEPAGFATDKSNVSGGWPWSLTLSVRCLSHALMRIGHACILMVAMASIASGCRDRERDRAEESFHKGFQFLSREVDVQKLQTWALEVLRFYPEPTNFVTAGPPLPVRLPHWGAGPMASVSAPDTNQQRYVQIIWLYASGSRACMLHVGSTNFTMPINEHRLLWSPGVYFSISS
jgi:hypothetical protein